MKDTIIKGDGTSRIAKYASVPNTFAEFRAALLAGTLPFDLSINPGGCDVVGTPLAKNTLLRPDGVAFTGLSDAGATPADIFARIYEPGDIKLTRRQQMPASWMLCNGDMVHASEFPELESVLPSYPASETEYTGGVGSYDRCVYSDADHALCRTDGIDIYKSYTPEVGTWTKTAQRISAPQGEVVAVMMCGDTMIAAYVDSYFVNDSGDVVDYVPGMSGYHYECMRINASGTTSKSVYSESDAQSGEMKAYACDGTHYMILTDKYLFWGDASTCKRVALTGTHDIHCAAAVGGVFYVNDGHALKTVTSEGVMTTVAADIMHADLSSDTKAAVVACRANGAKLHLVACGYDSGSPGNHAGLYLCTYDTDFGTFSVEKIVDKSVRCMSICVGDTHLIARVGESVKVYRLEDGAMIRDTGVTYNDAWFFPPRRCFVYVTSASKTGAIFEDPVMQLPEISVSGTYAYMFGGKIDVADISTFAGIRRAVQSGQAPTLLPVGSQITVPHTVYGDIVFDVVAHNYMRPADGSDRPTMTILSHVSLPAMQFDAPEAFYYAETNLPAGTYHFSIPTAVGAWTAGSYQFTLSAPLPAGSQLCINGDASAAVTSRKVIVYHSRTDTTARQTLTIISGTGGTSLGTMGDDLNHASRVAYGSNNYAESALRQYLNSDDTKDSVWTPMTKYDRPPAWHQTKDGLIRGFDDAFLSVIGAAMVPCNTNKVFESQDSAYKKGTAYTCRDLFCLPSRIEVYGAYSGTGDGSVQYPYYVGTDVSKKTKLSTDGKAHGWGMRTPSDNNSNQFLGIAGGGSTSAFNASALMYFPIACTVL